jgi:hypothetical protein
MGHSSNSTVAPRTSITAMLSVRNGAKAIEFYRQRSEPTSGFVLTTKAEP